MHLDLCPMKQIFFPLTIIFFVSEPICHPKLEFRSSVYLLGKANCTALFFRFIVDPIVNYIKIAEFLR